MPEDEASKKITPSALGQILDSQSKIGYFFIYLSNESHSTHKKNTIDQLNEKISKAYGSVHSEAINKAQS